MTFKRFQNQIKKSIIERKLNMENKTNKIPKMMTVKEVAATGLLPESAIRRLLREKKIAAVYSGKKAFINFDMLCNQLANLQVGA